MVEPRSPVAKGDSWKPGLEFDAKQVRKARKQGSKGARKCISDIGHTQQIPTSK